MKHVSTITRALILVSFVVLAQPQMAWSGDNGKQKNNQAGTSSTAPDSLNKELGALRAKVALLEAALKEQHQGQTRSTTTQGKANQATQGEDVSKSSRVRVVRKSASANATQRKKRMKAKDRMGGGMKRMKPGKKMGMGMMPGRGKKVRMMPGKGMEMGMMGGGGGMMGGGGHGGGGHGDEDGMDGGGHMGGGKPKSMRPSMKTIPGAPGQQIQMFGGEGADEEAQDMQGGKIPGGYK